MPFRLRSRPSYEKPVFPMPRLSEIPAQNPTISILQFYYIQVPQGTQAREPEYWLLVRNGRSAHGASGMLCSAGSIFLITAVLRTGSLSARPQLTFCPFSRCTGIPFGRNTAIRCWRRVGAGACPLCIRAFGSFSFARTTILAQRSRTVHRTKTTVRLRLSITAAGTNRKVMSSAS